MSGGDYAAQITGIRLLRSRELSPEYTEWKYEAVEGFCVHSARGLVENFPENLEMRFLDPEREGEAYIFVRRGDGDQLVVMRGGHGHSSSWENEPASQIVEALLASPFVKRPVESYESFAITTIPFRERKSLTRHV